MRIERRTLLITLGFAAAGTVAAAGPALLGDRREDGHRRPTPPPRPVEPPHRRPRPPDPDTLFRTGTELILTVTGTPAKVRTQGAGRLHLPTGWLIAVDPSWLASWRTPRIRPFTARVPPGSYPVTLALLDWRDDDGSTGTMEAAAQVTIHDEPAATWEFALRPGQDPATLADDEFFGVGVDSGTIGLVDAVAQIEMARLSDEAFSRLEPPSAGQFANVVDPKSGANLIAFGSGMGDGYYPVWVGRASDGSVSSFVLDLLIPHEPTHVS